MNIAEIWDKQKALNEELDNMPSPQDQVRVAKILQELDELEKLEDEAIKVMAEETAERLAKEHEEFCKRDYGPNSDPYYLLKWFLNNDSLNCIYTDDAQYGDWKKFVPEKWIEELKDKNEILTKYFEVMGQLEEVFNKVCNFQTSCPGHFPDHRLKIIFEDSSITMRLIEGQGSDFQIWKSKELDDAENSDHPPYILLSWENLLYLSKLNSFKQALWYKDFIKKWYEETKSITPDSLPKDFNEDLVLWRLGAACAGAGFVKALNALNFREEVENWI